MAIAAIETRYAGCKFRSRLEARWAVAFDHLNLAWEYEPQGYLLRDREPHIPYLPDFWLPTLNLWVEVKGADDQMDRGLIGQAAVPETHGGLPGSAEYRMLILGPIPRPNPRDVIGHTLLRFNKGDLYRDLAAFIQGDTGQSFGDIHIWRTNTHLVGNDSDCRIRDDENLVDHVLMQRYTTAIDAPFRSPHRAYTAARSARFEHGAAA